jgi:arginine/lysine/ornithine decarboxylase
MQTYKSLCTSQDEEVVCPLADNIIELKQKINCSFHALPIFRGYSVDDLYLKKKYMDIFGDSLQNAEMTVVGKEFDSFFFPENTRQRSHLNCAMTSES